MCGISGYFAKQTTPAAAVEQMNRCIRHRGPDDEGFFHFAEATSTFQIFSGADTPKHVLEASSPSIPKKSFSQLSTLAPGDFVLGHRRLSILDTSPAGHQPMCSPDEQLWITYNGEVYNYLELRTELQALGHVFHTGSDTEVVLHAYQEWGADCLVRFNGMFAFLLIDRKSQTVFAARDRFGVKPLYYWCSEHGIAFGSEIKQFTFLPEWSARLNSQRAYDFLAWSILDHTDETLFQNVFQLRGGQFLEMPLSELAKTQRGDRLPVKSWYELRAREFSGSFADASQKLTELLTQSVRLRLRADVPVGSCLSGGLDSSSIVCVMNQILREMKTSPLQKTFSACSEYKKFDESHYMDIVTAATQTEPHKCYPHFTEALANNERLVWHQDEPFGSSSIFAQWSVFKLAANQEVRVMLDGQGADEQLAGYDNYLFARLAERLKSLHLLSFWREFQATKIQRGFTPWRLLASTLNYLLPNFLRQFLRPFMGKASAWPNWIDMKKLGAFAQDPMHEKGAVTTSIRGMSLSQLTASNLQMLLHWEDRDSMAHSIESRLPFLDYRLVEFVLGLPDAYKISEGITKKVLREGMKNILPERVRMRMDKLGFVTAEENWIKEASPQFRQQLKSAVENSQGILNKKILENFEDMVCGKRPFNHSVWRAISFGTWMQRFNVKA